MVEVAITWDKVTKVWWSLVWRSLLFGFIAGFVAGFIIGFIGAIAHIDISITRPLCVIGGLLTGIPVGFWVIKYVLNIRYKDFRIALVSNVQ